MMPGKIRAVKIIYQILACLCIISVIVGIIVIATGGILGGLLIKGMETKGYEPEAGDAAKFATGSSMIASIFVLPLIILGTILFIFYIIIAKGVASKRNWGKVLAIIFGILMLPTIPIGTILGIFILLNIFSDQSKIWFGEIPAPTATTS